MRSARRRALIEKKKRSGKVTGLFDKIVLPILLILGIFTFYKLSTKYWNGNDKFILVHRLDNGDVAVNVLDPKLDEFTSLIIPGDTQVDVARNYGEFRIKSVWQLGVNEKLGGSLLAQTITQNFLFPVILWSDSDAGSLFDGNTIGILRFMFFPKSTNIGFGDRVSAGIFAMQTQSSNKNLLDLGKSQYLLKQKLNDGFPGYILNGLMSPRLTAYFSDNSLANTNLRVAIGDGTGVPGVAESVGQIIEVMGGKIVSIDKKESINTDCFVFGSEKEAVKKIAGLFNCKVTKNPGNFDTEIDLGSGFAKRF